MKIVVIGGTGLIGSKLVAKLDEHGHDAVPASPNSGVDTVTGKGLSGVLVDASVVVDVSNAPDWPGCWTTGRRARLLRLLELPWAPRASGRPPEGAAQFFCAPRFLAAMIWRMNHFL